MNACKKAASLLVLFLLWLPGCAFTNVPLELPDAGVSRQTSGGRDRQVIIVVPFEDGRAIRDRCGMKKNGYNMDTADAVCTSDPMTWIAQRLAAELRAAGFRVLREGDPHTPSAVVINGELIKLFVEPVIGFWSGSLEADLSVRLTASSLSGLRAERVFFAKAWRGGQILVTSGAYQTALRRCAEDLLGQLVKSVLELMERYPGLGLDWRVPSQRLARAGVGG